MADTTRRDALARSLAARICDERRGEWDLRRLDSCLGRIEREHFGDPLTVYVAGASSEIERVQAAIEALTPYGIVVTSTWPAVIAATPGGANPVDASRVDRLAWTSQDLHEVISSDVLLFLVPRTTTRGAWVELGVAWSHGVHLICAGTTKQSIFCAVAEEFESDLDAIAHVVKMARRRA